MIEGLLLLARADSESLRPSETDLGPVIRDRVDYWSPLADEQGITLIAEPPPVDLTILTVPTGIEQIIDNLIDNALEASPSGSDILIRVDVHPDTIDLHIIDQGPGLSAEQRTQAFDRFWRSPDASHAGTGLGLAIVQQLAEASGGRARLDDNPGGGIDAVITLPLAPDS